jgi:uncharacterized protein
VAEKPVPIPGAADRPYWDGLLEEKLVLARCVACGWYAQRVQPLCPNCRGESFRWEPVSGRGTIYAFTVIRQTWVAGFEEEIPYVVVAVAVDEQPSLLLVTNLVGDPTLDEIELDLPVVAAFERRGDAALLQFELDRSNR